MPPRKYCYWSVWAAVPRLKGLQGHLLPQALDQCRLSVLRRLGPLTVRPVPRRAQSRGGQTLGAAIKDPAVGRAWGRQGRGGSDCLDLWARPRLRPLGPLRPPPPATQACLWGSTGMRRAQGGRAVRGRAPPGPHLRPPSRSISCARDRCHHGRPGGCLCHQQRALVGGSLWPLSPTNKRLNAFF